MQRLRELLRDRRAATAVEYGLILALIFLAAVGAVRGFATEAINMWETVDNAVSKR